VAPVAVVEAEIASATGKPQQVLAPEVLAPLGAALDRAAPQLARVAPVVRLVSEVEAEVLAEVPAAAGGADKCNEPSDERKPNEIEYT